MDRYRLIAGIGVLLVYLLAMYPIQTIVVAVVIAIAYYILTNMPGRQGEYSNADNGKEYRRRQALREAKIYLAPYRDIWRNLTLSNKFCSMRLGANGTTITARDKIVAGREFRVMHSKIHSETDLWDMFCRSFEHNTSFDGLVQLCRTFNVDISIKNPNQVEEKANSDNPVSVDIISDNSFQKEKLDVNNASEIELTALPGISIVMAKKLIKKRDELQGFKSVDDIILFLHLKPHMEKQLRELICVNKMQGIERIKRYNERRIDL